MEKIKAYLGIDIGSVSTNLAVMDEGNNLIAQRYLPTAGRPIDAVRRGLSEIGEEIGDKIEILGAGTTGSGRYMIGELVGADMVKNEITAQATGALNHDPMVDTIFEIGGQDSKYISLEKGVIVDFAMNKACAAGTGSFLEEQAEKLGINIIQEFSALALSASQAVPLGDRCTVFIESELNHHLQNGASKPELAAGLAVAIVKNYLNKVVENRRIGKNIFFQGGVASNQSVVRAFENITGRKITVPPYHDVTGAVGIALLVMRERNWDKSKFKGFDLANRNYSVKSFECKSCPNLCEINRVTLDKDEPVFFGGRCEKYEKKISPAFHDLPDLFQERDQIIFSGEVKAGNKKIGIPRVLFFYERYPFWKAFFSSLGLEVVLSDPSTASMVEESQENVTTEACFPITLAHGHVKNLIEKGIDYLFLPSLIDMEKASDKFTQHFNCPFVQALPYFIRSSFNFDARIKILDQPLEPMRSKKYYHRQLVRLAKQLGKNRFAARRAIKLAELAYRSAELQLKQKGKEVLAWIEKEKIPALAIISRSYNGSDPILNLNIPHKLREMGIVAIPMDFLPIDRASLAEEHPNIYWDCGQKIVAAAKFIEQRPALSAIHITNFRCGPDSFISHLVRETIRSKPYLAIEVDGHASDTGIITRIEAFLDSLKNNKAVPEKEKRARPVSFHRKRTVYLPRMCDHAEALAAAMRACGIETQVLPPSDEKTLELGRKYTSGKECHPFTVTTGDFLKKINQPGFDPEHSAFFMATASGPCRFGQYNQAQKLLFKQLGYSDIPILSPDVKDSYGRSIGLGLKFRRLAWHGILAVDLLNELTAEKRPYEKEPGTADRLHDGYLTDITRAVEAGRDNVYQLIKEMKADFASIPLINSSPHQNFWCGDKPLIGIVGEIFLRYNPQCNADMVRRVEKLGGKTYTAPISEWFYYTNLGYIYESWMRGLPRHLFASLIADLIQRRDEKKIGHHQPSALSLIRKASPYLHYTYKGEAALSIGKAIDLIKHGAAGIINIMPFTCMPGTVVSALSRRVKEDYPGIPWLDVPIDGTEGVNLEVRLEAFMHQAVSSPACRQAGNAAIPRHRK